MTPMRRVGEEKSCGDGTDDSGVVGGEREVGALVDEDVEAGLKNRRLHGEIDPGPGLRHRQRSGSPTAVKASPPNRRRHKAHNSLYESRALHVSLLIR